MEKLHKVKNFCQENYINLLALCGVIYIGKYSYEVFKKFLLKSYFFFNKFKLRKMAKKCLEDRNVKVKNFLDKYADQISEQRINEIVRLSASELTVKIKEQKITSREATLAYCIRSATIGVLLCLVNDVRFEEAVLEAEKADELIKNATDVNTLPPLIGLPFSVKDVVKVKGMITTLGYQFLAENKCDADSLSVETLKSLGVIIYCLTNVPQGLFAIEASNNVFGQSQNPWDRRRTPGGSSGGCAGLVSSFCSPISFCGDIGGSTRIPSHFTGLYGIKPSEGRITTCGQLKVTGDEFTGFKNWLACPGVIARTYDDVLLLARNLYGKFDKDFRNFQRPFDYNAYEQGLVNSYNRVDEKTGQKKKIKIAIIKELTISESFVELRESIEKIKENLEKQGYEVCEFDQNKFYEVADEGTKGILYTLNFLELCLRGEEKLYYFKFPFYANSISKWRSKSDQFFLRNVFKEPRLAEYYKWVDTDLKYTGKFLLSSNQLEKQKEKFYQHLRENEIEAIIMPVMPFPAAFRNDFKYQFLHLYYTMTINMLNLSAGSIPLKTIEKTDYVTKYNDRYSKWISKSMESAKGMPYGIQVCTLPNQDERCLRVMKEVDEVFKFSASKDWDTQFERSNTYSQIKATGKS